VALHSFYDHNGVVNHQPDSQHKTEEREGVDGEAEKRKKDKRPDQRNWNGQERD
jgi:hypothetical protein